MGTRFFSVTIRPEGIKPQKHIVEAPDEWKARTRAMMKYDGPRLGGRFVDYDVVPVYWSESLKKYVMVPE